MGQKVAINYTSRDFNSFRNDLIEYTKKYYPNTYKDWNEASIGSLMIDTVAYTGDILSFYLDYQANEGFLDTAVEYDNIIKKGRSLGYRFKGAPSSFGVETFYIVVPSKSSGLGPDPNYIPVLLKGSELTSESGNGFIVNENIDFSNSNNEVVVAEVNENTGVPTSYAIKAKGQIISGELSEEIFTIGPFEKFLKVRLNGDNISEIISVVDAEGHEYYEVDFLSQNVIYVPVINTASDKEKVSSVLKPVAVTRRFIVEEIKDATYLQFGYGSQETIKLSSVADPSAVVLQRHGKDYTVDSSFDPSKLLSTDKFGVAPSNTVLRVVYRKNSSDNVNAASNTITVVANSNFRFSDYSTLNSGKMSDVVNSLEVTNETPVVGDVTTLTTEELKRRIFDTFASQNRAVTLQDYKSCVYNMPPAFGAVKRVNVVQDHDSFKRNLNMYIISENEDGTLTASTDTLKKNLRVWISKNKMINDTVDILDAKIVNIGINFEIVAEREANKYVVLNNAYEKLVEYYRNHFDIGEPFSITKIYSILNGVEGLSDVVSVKIILKNGGLYSDTRFDLEKNMSQDGRYIDVPENIILEFKYPKIDFSGVIK